jgi:hypothetical protein
LEKTKVNNDRKICLKIMFEEADEPSSDIEESAALALNSLLPEKSKEKYKKAYKDFENWCSEKRVKHDNEEVQTKSKRNMTGRSLECGLSNLALAGAYHTIVSLEAKT